MEDRVPCSVESVDIELFRVFFSPHIAQTIIMAVAEFIECVGVGEADIGESFHPVGAGKYRRAVGFRRFFVSEFFERCDDFVRVKMDEMGHRDA